MKLVSRTFGLAVAAVTALAAQATAHGSVRMMRILLVAFALLMLAASGVVLAQSTTGFLSIPASGFTPRNSEWGGNSGYDGNETGTARLFAGSQAMFAPVNLPHGASVTSLRCGGQVRSGSRLAVVLRRNDPQQANVDMAAVSTLQGATGFQVLTTSSIISPVIDNRRFNYYVMATAIFGDVGFCESCSIGFCRVTYTVSD